MKDWPEGLKHTRQREEVFALLQSADRPMRALDIYESLRGSGCASMSTVYRVLDAFEKAAQVEKFYLPDDDNAYYKKKEQVHCHYATCLICHRQIPLKGCPVTAVELTEELPDEEFTVVGHRLEIYGYCRECRKKLNGGHSDSVIE